MKQSELRLDYLQQAGTDFIRMHASLYWELVHTLPTHWKTQVLMQPDGDIAVGISQFVLDILLSIGNKRSDVGVATPTPAETKSVASKGK